MRNSCFKIDSLKQYEHLFDIGFVEALEIMCNIYSLYDDEQRDMVFSAFLAEHGCTYLGLGTDAVVFTAIQDPETAIHIFWGPNVGKRDIKELQYAHRFARLLFPHIILPAAFFHFPTKQGSALGNLTPLVDQNGAHISPLLQDTFGLISITPGNGFEILMKFLDMECFGIPIFIDAFGSNIKQGWYIDTVDLEKNQHTPVNMTDFLNFLGMYGYAVEEISKIKEALLDLLRSMKIPESECE